MLGTAVDQRHTHKRYSIVEFYTWTHQHDRPAKTYILELNADTGCRLEEPPRAKDDRERWQNHLTMSKQMSFTSFKDKVTYKTIRLQINRIGH